MPRIIVSTSPALLIRIDGDPDYRPVNGTSLERIVNTKALILRDEAGMHYLKILDGWMEAYSLSSWWSVAGAPPEGADVALEEAVASKSVDLLDKASTNAKASGGDDHPSLERQPPPQIYISTTPAVLIVTDGAPRFTEIAGTSLESAENATAPLFRDRTDQELYVFVSGQWLRSWKTEGPWQVVPSHELPADFNKISDARFRTSAGGLK